MTSSLGGVLEDGLRARVLRSEPDFTSAGTYVSSGDVVVCPAPLIIGQLLAAKQELRVENKQLGLTPTQRQEIQYGMTLLDLYIKLQVRACARNSEEAGYVEVCKYGRIFIRAKNLRKIAA